MNYYQLAFLAILFSCDVEQPIDKTTRKSEHKEKREESAPVKNGLIRIENEETGVVNEITYDNGLKTGPARSYYPDGTLWKENNYLKNALQGTAKLYDQQGRIKREVEYEKNEYHGHYKEFFKSGNPKLEIEYFHGKPLLGYYEKDFTAKSKAKPKIIVNSEEKRENNLKMIKLEFSLDQEELVYKDKGSIFQQRVKYYFIPKEKTWKEVLSLNSKDILEFSIGEHPDDPMKGFFIGSLQPGELFSLEGQIIAVFDYKKDIPVAVSKDVRITFENF